MQNNKPENPATLDSRVLSAFDSEKSIELAAQVLFFLFIIYVFIGGKLFEGRSLSVLAEQTAAGRQGDSFRQLFYIVAALFVFFLNVVSRRRLTGADFPFTLLLFLAWAAITIPFAIEPLISMRRFVLAILVIYVSLSSLSLLGIERILALMTTALAFTIVISLLAIPFVPSAVHPSSELDPRLAGAWMGIFNHKNTAAAVTGIGAILSVFCRSPNSQKTTRVVLFVSALLLLYGTRGKASSLLLMFSVLMSCAYLLILKTKNPLHNCVLVASSVLLVTAVVFYVGFDEFSRWISSPESLTGRVGIWQAVWVYAMDHLLLGAGYESFWNVGEASPIFTAANTSWITLMPHSHNGYLDLLVTLGVPGLVLGLVTFVFLPLYYFCVVSEFPGDERLKATLFGLWLFAICTNLTESQILSRDRYMWVTLLLVVCGLRQLRLKHLSNV
jgi:O-antigen ligase